VTCTKEGKQEGRRYMKEWGGGGKLKKGRMKKGRMEDIRKGKGRKERAEERKEGRSGVGEVEEDDGHDRHSPLFSWGL
jgi:hypothetical protein